MNWALTGIETVSPAGKVEWIINGLTGRAAIRIFRALQEFAPARPGFFVE
jgi:hypothetical protein